MSGAAQSVPTVHDRKMQSPRLSAPGGASGEMVAGVSGHVVVVARFTRLPQMPCVAVLLTVKQIPRHWVFRGVVSPGTMVVRVGLHGNPSARRELTNPCESQSPVRGLQRRPLVHCVLFAQKGVQPVTSG